MVQSTKGALELQSTGVRRKRQDKPRRQRRLQKKAAQGLLAAKINKTCNPLINSRGVSSFGS